MYIFTFKNYFGNFEETVQNRPYHITDITYNGIRPHRISYKIIDEIIHLKLLMDAQCDDNMIT